MPMDGIYDRYVPAITPPAEGIQGKIWRYVFSSGKLLVHYDGKKALLPCVESLSELKIEPIREQYLGSLDGLPCFSVEAAPGLSAPEGMEYMDLRSLYTVLEDQAYLLAGKALQIVAWDQTHQFCGKCGAPTRSRPDERAKECTKCGFLNFPRLSPAIIVAVVKDGRLLLAHNKHARSGFYSVIAGFVEPGENFEECVRREVGEEVGIKVKNIKYFGSQPWPFPNSLMIGFTAEYDSGEIKVDEVEIQDADWYTADQFPPEIPSKISISRRLIDWYVDNH